MTPPPPPVCPSAPPPPFLSTDEVTEVSLLLGFFLLLTPVGKFEHMKFLFLFCFFKAVNQNDEKSSCEK